jgi:predicted sugar kinase
MNQKQLNQFCTVERELSKEKGPFKLFALIELEEVPGRWDVVMSSKELPDRDMETLRFVVNKIYAIVSKKEIVKISRVILLNVNEPFVTALEKFLSLTHNPKEIFGCEIDELKIKHAHIIVSPVKDEAKILVNAATFNDLVNRITRLENELALHG